MLAVHHRFRARHVVVGNKLLQFSGSGEVLLKPSPSSLEESLEIFGRLLGKLGKEHAVGG